MFEVFFGSEEEEEELEVEGEPKGEGDGKVEGEGEEDQTEEEVEETQQGKRKREEGGKKVDKKKGKMEMQGEAAKQGKAAKKGKEADKKGTAVTTDTYKAGQYVVLKEDLEGEWRIVEIVKTESSGDDLFLNICYKDAEGTIESTVKASQVSCTTNNLITYC